MYFKTLSKSECCACTACEHACPVSAITFLPDEEGFLYPSINKDKCINCGLCERVCPVAHPSYSNSEAPAAYAAMVKDVEQRKKSSSGGMFYAIACWILQQGGKVYGASMDENHQVKHIGVDNVNDLQLLRGSKYVQSDLQCVFADIKNDLKAGRWCYFVGTGCQVAGLKAFLRKDYETLLTSDLVCHGVPSQWLFDRHIQYLEEKHKGKVSGYQFRNNKTWGGSEIFNLRNPKGKVKRYKFPSYNLSPYLYSFMYAMTYRYSCYDCKFARIPRQGDITLADYWGVKEFFPNLDSSKGISLTLVNSPKGAVIFEQIKNMCEVWHSTIADGAKHNGNLIHVSEKNGLREISYREVKEKGYAKVAKKTFRAPNYYSTLIKCKLAEYKIMKGFIEWKNRRK
ncbi:Coenzyme F420 hydrogenase/dehydrogenase, beta subunit N-term [Bacteroides faecichinchillae]|uniref:Coenzyme F420 hydrogenase/dehydrogenase, beta subunit N-term n=1 Tax=Bacteroides faecichinchillae TaxID=871325 RepID=A0A1M5DT23_9BACE|nr:Coenzyme F420 hydrogenase/dehydrogenase, beta subunit C-terminal domain [Bacteroides faecichinchillae]THG64034.1 4Fe-4S dicluster domain-containing protein [Bacteroides faecichinchillae]SHF69991.1 Coenzyme F420 hydrogenase/dehydrogenase, beta subunit N-term [Bacteroides faecichinchillae]